MQTLAQELKNRNLLPYHVNWQGTRKTQSYDELVAEYSHIAPDHMQKLLQRLIKLSATIQQPPAPGLTSLLGEGQFSLIEPTNDIHQQHQNSLVNALQTNFAKSTINYSTIIISTDL